MAQENSDATVLDDLGQREGVFFDSLTRSSSKIRKDRAADIAETAEMFYKRKIEDLELNLKQALRQRNNMLDLSPETTTSLILAKDFDGSDFYSQDTGLSLTIRETAIKLLVAKNRYKKLFGQELPTPSLALVQDELQGLV